MAWPKPLLTEFAFHPRFVSAYSNVVIKLLLVQQKFFLFHRIIRMEISGLKKAVPTVSELFGDMSYGPGVVTNRHFDTKNIARSHWSSWTGCY